MGWSSGVVSLAEILAGNSLDSHLLETALSEIAQRLVIGGWPEQIEASESVACKRNRAYLDNIVEADISRVSGVRRDPVRVRRIFESYARNIATPAKVSTIMSDVGEVSVSVELGRATVTAYLNDLTRLMIIDNLPAWNTHIRSAAKLRVTPKRHLADPSLAAAALGLSSQSLIKELHYMGFLFEALVVHDVRIYAEALGASAYYYLDTEGDEVDLIIERVDGRFAAFEVKVGMGAVDEAILSLNRFKNRMTDEKKQDLLSLNVIVSSGHAYTRPDGVNVIPIGMLGV